MHYYLLGFISEKNEYFWGKRNRLIRSTMTTGESVDWIIYLYFTLLWEPSSVKRSKRHYRVGDRVKTSSIFKNLTSDDMVLIAE